MEYKASFQTRILILGLIIFISILVVSSDYLYEKIILAIKYTESIIYEFPLYGILLFVLLAMASAMLAFYSSAILVPVGVYAWGSIECFFLLWIGWVLGGILSFGIGSYLGRSITIKLFGDSYVEKFDEYIYKHAKFIHVVIFQAVLPSEIPGYILGSLKYRFSYYLTALMIVELPYAIGTVALGSSFLQRNTIIIFIIGLGTIIVSIWGYILFKKHIHIN